MSKKSKKNKDQWSWNETPEVKEALRKLKEHDDKLGYDTSGK